ncbi:kynurenine formamidase isoform X2 [Galleria mellonella]|uniref:Kynurenine formamidase isoform X2 n=1 Tax=Galleria mellonella TaxID=7137 RepID=A0ABM3MRQ4_GALME|nr:kynurenine formamidase isoform X2 [Galleria mellonella]
MLKLKLFHIFLYKINMFLTNISTIFKTEKVTQLKEQSSNMSVILESLDLEREYTPSMWSERFATSQEVLQHHVQHVTEASEVATNKIPHKLEIEYGSTNGQKLDILGTDLPDDSPILVYVHGGYWQEMSREISRYPALPLYRSKIKTIVVGYDLCPTATLAEIVNQILSAAKFVFEYAEKMDSRGVYFAGHSAGAHLVAKLLSNGDFLESTVGSSRLRGAFLVSGVYDLRELTHTTVNDAVQLPNEWAIPLSPQFDSYTHLQERKVRIYILAGQNDSPTFKRQSREFYELLHNTCLMQNMYLEIKDNMDHFDIVECFANDDNFLKNLLVHDIRKHL